MKHSSSTSGSRHARLSAAKVVLAEEHQDVRGCAVLDRDGKEIGRVDDLFVDERERRVRMLHIRSGERLGDRHFLLPVEKIANVATMEVRVDETLERIAGSPYFEPNRGDVSTRHAWELFYGYYGLPPYWKSGYTYPNFPLSKEEAMRRDRFDR